MEAYGTQKAKATLAEAAQASFESSSNVEAADDAREANDDSSTTGITLPEPRTPKSALTNPDKVDKSKSSYSHSIYLRSQLIIYQIHLCRRKYLGLQIVRFKHSLRDLDRKTLSLDMNATATD